MTTPAIIHIVDWKNAASRARKVRDAVFIVEQKVPVDLEWDDWDARSEHALALDENGEPIGTGRLLPDGHLGRMAVLASWRGAGVGRSLALALLQRARDRGMKRVVLHAQKHAADFYLKLGFAAFGEPFEEAGIAHIAMAMDIS